jgi:hypothetical protein
VTTEEDHEKQKLMSWGLWDVTVVFLRFLEPDQHLRGCNQQQLPSNTARWKLLLLQVFFFFLSDYIRRS